jgi:hypothetical protein
MLPWILGITPGGIDMSNILADSIAGGVQGLLGGIGQAAKDLRSVITGEISPEQKAKIEAQVLQIEANVLQAQTERNREEAKHPSIWVSGARPAFLWLCVFIIGLHYGVRPILQWVFQLFEIDKTLYHLDISQIWPVLIGILGLGVYRTAEKIKGVNGRHG